jgi:hypothetical protein
VRSSTRQVGVECPCLGPMDAPVDQSALESVGSFAQSEQASQSHTALLHLVRAIKSSDDQLQKVDDAWDVCPSVHMCMLCRLFIESTPHKCQVVSLDAISSIITSLGVGEDKAVQSTLEACLEAAQELLFGKRAQYPNVLL